MSACLEAALRLAAQGLHVLPVAGGSKIPVRSGWQTFASCDAEAVRSLFADHRGNLAVATGARSGAWVLDVDCKDGAGGLETLCSLEAEHGAIEGAWRTRTPSGGLHLWFASPADRRIGNRIGVLPGLDVRGEGGFILVPPSRIGASQYVWVGAPRNGTPAAAPEWLLSLVAPPPRPILPRRPVAAVEGSLRLRRYVAAAVDAELGRVEAARPGSRNAVLFQAACALGSLVGAGVLPFDIAGAGLVLAAEACGLVADDGRRAVEATVSSGLKRGLAQPRAVAS